MLNCSDSHYFRIKSAVPVGLLCWGVHFTAQTQPWAPRSFQKTSEIKLWKGTDQGMGIKIFQWPWIPLGAQSRKSLRSGRRMVPPRPCEDQAVPPNWMTKQGWHWSERPPTGQWQLWKSSRPLRQRLVTVCKWQQYPKHSTSLVCTVGWQEGNHYSKKPTLSPVWGMQKLLRRFWSHVAKCFVIWRNQDGTFWPKCKTLRLAQTQPGTSPKEHHPYCKAWWWQHHVMWMFLISRDRGTC